MNPKTALTFMMAIIAAISLLLSACTITYTPESNQAPVFAEEKGSFDEEIFEPDVELNAKNFKTTDEFIAFVKKNSDSSYYGVAYRSFSSGIDNVALSAGVAMGETSEKAADSGDGTDYSQTNNQIASVDEADIIKTDGEYIYTVSGKTLYIIKAYPGEDAEIISTIGHDSNPSGIFINGDYMAVFGNFYDLDWFDSVGITPRLGMTFFNIYDISDKDEPELVKEYKFEGNYFQARMIDGHVYFITTTGLLYRTPRPMPLIIEGDVVREIPVSDIFYYPIPYQNPQFANIHAIKITEPEKDINSISVAIEGSRNMYMSENNIYITYTQYIDEWQIRWDITREFVEPLLGSADQNLIEKIKATDDEVLSNSEKKQKIMQIINLYLQYMPEDERDALTDEIETELKERLDEYEYFEYTIINKIEVDEDDIDIGANGKVPGHVMNQFSMDENNDVLRIAATLNARRDSFGKERTESSNNIYTLDKNLDIMDSLTGLAEGERIFSTRFIGDRLYMVTFRQVDPFFVIDLSDPDDIEELGELKIPGFSRYLHPYDEDTIIGIGRDATETGRTHGLKISLFDVSDVENPEEVAKFVTEEKYAQSTAEYEHKAFLFSKEKELLVIPAYSYDYRGDSQSYNGAMVFRITKDSIEIRGIIDHSTGGDNYYYRSMVERSLYIEELLYTKSSGLLRINEIDDLSSVNEIELTGSEGPIPIY